MAAVYHKLTLALFFISVLGLSLWSWVLVDPNFTLIEHRDWAVFREWAVQIGYFDRPASSQFFVFAVCILMFTSFALVWKPPKNIMILAIVVGVIAGLLSYPALSHDLFNYIFDARILTHYGQNPYLHKALDFPTDPMLRFMHWTHRTYPYGPTYLLLSLIPSLLGMSMFSVTFFLFKLAHVVLYLLVVRALQKINHKAAAIFAFSPLVIVEGLINTHNDFVAVSIGILGINAILHKQKYLGSMLLIASGLVKYLTLPLIAIISNHSTRSRLVRGKTIHLRDIGLVASVCGICTLLLYLVTYGELHPWYFLNLLVFLPYFDRIYIYLYPSIFGLLLSYYPYVLGGDWGQGGDVSFKNTIIIYGFLANILCVCAYRVILSIHHRIRTRETMY